MKPSPIDDLRSEIAAESQLPAVCPQCHGRHVVRSGFVRDRQRHQCQDCHFHYTTGRRGKSPALKRMALHLYLEGMGFRAIGRILNVSNVTVMNWIHAFAEQVDPIRKPEGQDLEIVEIDEMFTFIQQKKTSVGSGSLWIDSATDSSVSYWVREPSEPDDGSGSNSTIPKAASRS